MGTVCEIRSISCEGAQCAISAAVKAAELLNVAVQIAIVDQAGSLVAHLRMDGAFIPSGKIALDKAYTAVGFGLPTSSWQAELPPGSALRESIMHQPSLAFFGGGLPIIVGGQVVGGIGVSGGSEEQDEICAQAGCDALAL